jgi:hypothetical protein
VLGSQKFDPGGTTTIIFMSALPAPLKAPNARSTIQRKQGFSEFLKFRRHVQLILF